MVLAKSCPVLFSVAGAANVGGVAPKLNTEQARKLQEYVNTYHAKKEALQKQIEDAEAFPQKIKAASEAIEKMTSDRANLVRKFDDLEKTRSELQFLISNDAKDRESLSLLDSYRQSDRRRLADTDLPSNESWFARLKKKFYGSGETLQQRRARISEDLKSNLAETNALLAKLKSVKEIEGSKAKLAELEGPTTELLAQIKRMDYEIDQQELKLEELKLQGRKKYAPYDELRRLGGEDKVNYTKSALALYEEYTQKSTVDLKKVLSTLMALNVQNTQIASEDLSKKILSVSAELNKAGTLDPGQFKVKLETTLAQRLHDNKSLLYNKDKAQLTAPIFENRMNCYSGTSLFLVMNELSANPANNMVVIFQEGHVLPGYVVKKDNAYVLYGLETTAAGTAIIKFGDTSKVSGDIRVFDARQFLLSEALRPLQLENFDEVYTQMLESMKKFGFDPTKFKSKGYVSGANSTGALNETPFGFGVLNVSSGDSVRPSFAQKNYTPPAPRTQSAIAGSMTTYDSSGALFSRDKISMMSDDELHSRIAERLGAELEMRRISYTETSLTVTSLNAAIQGMPKKLELLKG